MTNVLIVHAHPEPASFNGALTRRAVEALETAGHAVTVSNLYAQGFDPVAGRHDFSSVANPDYFHYQAEQAHAAQAGAFSAELQREQERVAAADLLILQFPLWWGGAPAILKGWFERVLAYGFGYVDGARFENGLFRGRRALISVTTGGPLQRFTDGDTYGDIKRVLYPVQHLMIGYMGYEVEEPFVSYAAPRVADDVRQGYLDGFAARVLDVAAKPVNRIDTSRTVSSIGQAAWARSS